MSAVFAAGQASWASGLKLERSVDFNRTNRLILKLGHQPCNHRLFQLALAQRSRMRTPPSGYRLKRFEQRRNAPGWADGGREAQPGNGVTLGDGRMVMRPFLARISAWRNIRPPTTGQSPDGRPGFPVKPRWEVGEIGVSPRYADF